MKKQHFYPLLVLVVCSPSMWATEFSATHTLNSAYVFRGLVVNDEWVYQPYADFAHESGLYGWFWGNMDLSDNRGYPSYEFSECDLGLGYAWSVGKLQFSVEFAEYFYPSVSLDNTREVFLKLSYDTLFQPTLTFAEDIGEANGLYVMLSFAQNIMNSDALSVDATASMGWADSGYLDYYFGHDEASALDANFGVSASHTFTNGITVSASINYTWVTGDRALAAQARSWYGYDDLVWGGFSVSHSF